MTMYSKQLPQIISSESPFWEAAKRHELMMYRCENCGKYYWPAVDCVACEKPKMKWTKISGKGEVYTFTILHRAFPGWEKEVPYNVSWIKLDEGPVFLSNIIECKNQDLHIGMKVKVVFEDVTEEMTIPKFKPA
jgi:uncharacterized protein